ncbi:hypothetical protein MLD38_003338 [Melastoma candidum]|uniref:Uncharacterized protein n=1 Tax=Melastoma candidum TaxID=119954 RepID=A0ACB9S647_9MYRT|nr:hypothetical protein MLD38_003338 [Melastoma candidum]
MMIDVQEGTLKEISSNSSSTTSSSSNTPRGGDGEALADSVIGGITGDRRCLFHSVIHVACLGNGKQSLREALQKQLTDELRHKVGDEFVRRGSEAEWFVQVDFTTYAAERRKPHVWGGEPVLLMCSQALQ